MAITFFNESQRSDRIMAPDEIAECICIAAALCCEPSESSFDALMHSLAFR